MKELRIYKITDDGPKDNQDSCYVVQYKDSAALACIADGVSCQRDAKKTSEFITDYVEDWYAEEGDTIFSSQPEDVKQKMLDLVLDMHSDLLMEEGSMGSTIDLVIIGNRKMFITHVGDSRVYLFDGESMTQITQDQTVSEVEKTTGIKIRKVEEERKAHTLMQCVGSGELEPYQYEVDIPASCDILLCTDGLSNKLSAREMSDEFRKKQAGSDALVHLVKTARDRKESDNITAVLIRRREKPEKARKR